jgi:SAM-dependent methyltransferase
VASLELQELDPGSFRDRDGRVYSVEGRILRGVNKSALSNFNSLLATRFYERQLESGNLVNSHLLGSDEIPLPAQIKNQWAGFIEHQRIPVVTYPYEWTFGMLRDAARLQLDLVESAIEEDLTLKDATPYNFQFVSGRPIFIDIASFEPLRPGEPWAGYRQFCEMFLFPMLVQAYKGIHFQPLMRSGIDGIPTRMASRIFGLRDLFKRGIFGNVWLQSKFESRYANTDRNVRSELKSAGFNKQLILANIRKLRKLVEKLEWEGSDSEWGEYADFHNYSGHDQELKQAFVDECVGASGAQCVWDIGCNTGQYSRIARKHARQVIAMDLDHFAVEQLYREVKKEKLEGLTTIVQNVADPSPNWGWRNLERRDLLSRAKPDLVMCLALIHHVVISANIPLDEFVAWLADLSEHLVIEYVSRDDDKVKTLLRNKDDKYSDYSKQNLENALAVHFSIERSLALESGNRTLYWCNKSH